MEFPFTSGAAGLLSRAQASLQSPTAIAGEHHQSGAKAAFGDSFAFNRLLCMFNGFAITKPYCLSI
jgi:hypothetical protein